MNVLLVLLFAVAYLYSLHFAPWIKENYPKSRINRVHEQCAANVQSVPRWLLGGRGKNYILGAADESSQLADCTVTFWGATHFSLYLAIGFLCPEHGAVANAIGVLFELYEWRVLDCADPLDIVLNASGFMIGRAVRAAL